MATNGTHNDLKKHIEPLKVGEGIGHRNLTLMPLRGEGRGRLEYVLAAEAIEAGELTVTEVDESGSVPELLAVNSGEKMVLLLDGEELVGAKQNRILNTSVLLRPKSQTKIPVSCVEQGRWHHVSDEFSSGSYSPSMLRARKSRDVTRSLRETGRAHSDQQEVWHSVQHCMASTGTRSETMAMHDAVAQRQDSLACYTDALPYPQDARGVVAAINGKFAAADVFDQPRTLESVWPRLVTGYALDAISREADAGGSFSAKTAEVLLEHVGEVPCEPRPSPGLGKDWRFEAEDVVGQALLAKRVCVHLSAFPNDEVHRRAAMGPRIMPPSRRQR